MTAPKKTYASCALVVMSLAVTACGNGVPIQIRIDDFVTTIDMGQTTTLLEGALHGTGLLPPQGGIPEIWPDSLPSIRFSQSLLSPPLQINLSPSDPVQAKKYAQITKYKNAIVRIEFNELVIRLEENTLNIDLPELKLQCADKFDASADDRKAWQTVGKIPVSPADEVADHPFAFAPGGESFLNDQLSDDLKQFALRTNGLFTFDTDVNRERPSGKVTIRMIIVATFFVALEKL